MWFFVQFCSSWQDFNWLKASCGPSAIAELLVILIFLLTELNLYAMFSHEFSSFFFSFLFVVYAVFMYVVWTYFSFSTYRWIKLIAISKSSHLFDSAGVTDTPQWHRTMFDDDRKHFHFITFRASRRRREMYSGYGRLCVFVWLCVYLSIAAFPHCCTDPRATWGNGRGCPLVVHYWADLQSLHEFRCYMIT